MKTIMNGLGFLEGPRLDAEGTLYFSDIILGGIFRRRPDGTIKHCIPDRGWIGGLAVNFDGRIVASGFGGLVLVDCDTDEVEVLLDAVDGQPISRINDIQPDGKGGLYAGCINPTSEPNEQGDREDAPLVHVSSDRATRIVADGIKVSNGIGMSTDGRLLYQADSSKGVLAYDRAPDGSLSNQRLAINHPNADGIAVDCENFVWVASLQEAAAIRFAPDGSIDLRIDIPGPMTASLTFGGDDLKDLYVVTGSAINQPNFDLVGSVYLLRSPVAGQETPLTRF